MTQDISTDKRPKTVTVFVNNRTVELTEKLMTGAEIKVAADVPPDFQLYVEHGNNLELVADDEQVKVHPNQRFRAVSGQDVS